MYINYELVLRVLYTLKKFFVIILQLKQYFLLIYSELTLKYNRTHYGNST